VSCYKWVWPRVGVGCLPLVGSAVTTTEGVGLGILEGVQYGFIDGTEVHAEHFVDFVDHFGSSGIF